MYNNKKGHIVTGLSQKPSDTHYEYNFQNPKNFVKKILSLEKINFEMGMTNEITLFVYKRDINRIKRKIKAFYINKKCLFRIDIIKNSNQLYIKMFFQIATEKFIDKNTYFTYNKKNINFLIIFIFIAKELVSILITDFNFKRSTKQNKIKMKILWIKYLIYLKM